MGRKPIGDRPMTTTERSQRRRERIQRESAARQARLLARRENYSAAEERRRLLELALLEPSAPELAALIMDALSNHNSPRR